MEYWNLNFIITYISEGYIIVKKKKKLFTYNWQHISVASHCMYESFLFCLGSEIILASTKKYSTSIYVDEFAFWLNFFSQSKLVMVYNDIAIHILYKYVAFGLKL